MFPLGSIGWLLAAGLAVGGLRAADRLDETRSRPDASALREPIERYSADMETLQKSDRTPLSDRRRNRLRRFYADWQKRLPAIAFDALPQEDKIDYLLLRNHLARELSATDLLERKELEAAGLVPFAAVVVQICEDLRSGQVIDGRQAAQSLDQLNRQLEELQKQIPAAKGPKHVAMRAASEADELRKALKDWFEFSDGYDPSFSWWTGVTYKSVDAKLQSYAAEIREKLAGVKPEDKTTIIGNPIGRDALLEELRYEIIPYTPEQLIVLADREFAWCEAEARRAAREMGFGDDWHKALERVKNDFVPPGRQPQLIRDLANEALHFVEQHQLVTVPELARDTWRMKMMTPERQLVNPFFTGGDVMTVSYPTATMTFEQKLMSMRGNNVHFARATVFHELIPGHELQGFMEERYRRYRQVFATPFYVEGWALYWEMLFWDLHFGKTPEDRLGMLFWRMHRAARIQFSLNFQLGKWTPQQCIDILVTRVGHERENATAEVRRSLNGEYPPLYQAAYLLGGLQLRSLHKDLVDSGKMTNREFHDRVLQENAIPVELIRANLLKEKLTRDWTSHWEFYGSLSSQ